MSNSVVSDEATGPKPLPQSYLLVLTSFALMGMVPYLKGGHWIAHLETLETNETMKAPLFKRKHMFKRIRSDDATPAERRPFVGLSDPLHALIAGQMERLGIAPQDTFAVYLADSLEPDLLGSQSLGVLQSGFGLPYYFRWNAVEEVELSQIRQVPTFLPFVRYYFDWTPSFMVDEDTLRAHLTPEELQELKQTFVLSDQAKEFVVAKYLHLYQSTRRRLVNVGGMAVVGYLVLMTAIKLNDAGVRNMPFSVRLASYAGIVSLFLAVYVLVLTDTEVAVTRDVNRTLAEEGYAPHAKEYFLKQIRRMELLLKGQPDVEAFLDADGHFQRSPLSPSKAEATTPRSQLKYFEQVDLK